MPIVPKFLIKKLYQKGSLRTTDEGIAFDLKNIIGPGIIQKIICLRFNDQEFDPSCIKILTNGKTIAAEQISPESPVFFTFLQKSTCFLFGKPPLKEGKNKIVVELISREAGLIKVAVIDTLELNH